MIRLWLTPRDDGDDDDDEFMGVIVAPI